MIRNQLATGSAACAALLFALSMAGCATKPADPPPPPAPAVQPLEQTLQDAAQADASGSKERARELYRTAAKNYPASKAPWLKLADDYFQSSNYGQAILAAQEVLQRDPADTAASSVLAVSGLRVSSQALGLLRQQRLSLKGGTRVEAEELARVLRDQLGEPVLVPRPSAASAGANAHKRPAASAKTPAAAPAPAPASLSKTDTSNPFSVLKN